MVFNDFKDFVAKLPDTGRIIGVDWGAKRMGVAVSDESREFVFLRQVEERTGQSAGIIDRIIEIIVAEKITGVVIGLPTHADGTDSDTTRHVREFAEKVSVAVSVPIGFIDERLTSAEAEEYVGALGPTRRNLAISAGPGGNAPFRSGAFPRAPTPIDSHAAAIILENAIAMIIRLRRA